MAAQGFVLCRWKRRLWPAKVLGKPGAAGDVPVGTAKKRSFKAEILGLEKQVSVSSAGAVPLTEERIQAIASNLEQKNDVSEAVEELQYRCALKIALDLLSRAQPGPVSPAEGTNPDLPREDTGGSPPLSLSHCSGSRRSEAAKRRRNVREDPSRSATNPARSKTNPSRNRTNPSRGGTNPSRAGPRDSWAAPTLGSHSCKAPEAKSSPRQRKAQPRTGNKPSLKAKEGRSQPGRKRPRRDDSPRDQAQLPTEEGSLPVPSRSGTMEPAQGTGSRRGRTLSGSSGARASDELERSISSESESLAKQLDRRRVEGGQQLEGAVRCHLLCSCSCSNPSPHSWILAGPDPPGMSSRRVSSESFPPLSPLVDDEEEHFPRVLYRREPQSMEEGMLVWCKLRRYPYWPAVVKAVKRKPRRACVLFIDGTTNEKKRGFSVSLKSLKHFDCEEKQELIERAKENYAQEIEWCIQLILDYRIRVGCNSFTGSFLEYFAADISYPVRKQGHRSGEQMTFPSPEEEFAGGESSLENSPQKPLRKLLPDRSRAARDRENKKLVEFIVKSKGAEEHLLGILKRGRRSRWLQKFLSSRRHMTCVETYLEDEEQLDLVVDYLKDVYREMDTADLRQVLGDGIRFISDVLLPEAIICAIAAVDDIDYKKAEEKYIKGPPVTKREKELFDEQIRARKRLKAE
ncbi:MUM1 protein, partial [Pitta sordida]|nr:MUM1 protein [Pitta sordida]